MRKRQFCAACRGMPSSTLTLRLLENGLILTPPITQIQQNWVYVSDALVLLRRIDDVVVEHTCFSEHVVCHAPWSCYLPAARQVTRQHVVDGDIAIVRDHGDGPRGGGLCPGGI